MIYMLCWANKPVYSLEVIDEFAEAIGMLRGVRTSIERSGSVEHNNIDLKRVAQIFAGVSRATAGLVVDMEAYPSSILQQLEQTALASFALPFNVN